MKLFLINAVVVAASGLVAGSVLPAFFPSLPMAPLFVFSFALAFTLSRGFLASLPLVVVVGLVADVATLDRVGMLSGFAVGVAYTASFFSRRFVVEHVAFTRIVSGVFLGIAAMMFVIFSDALLSGIGAVMRGTIGTFSFGETVSLFFFGIAFATVSAQLARKYDDVTTRIGLGSRLHV